MQARSHGEENQESGGRDKAMNCEQMKSLLSPYLDDALQGAERLMVSRHLETCTNCQKDFVSVRQMQEMVASLGRKQAPVDLALKLRIAMSREMSMTWERRLQRLISRGEEAMNAF